MIDECQSRTATAAEHDPLPGDDDWFSLIELTPRLATLVWVEERLAEVLHEWSTIESHAPAAIVFAATSAHHRWHGEVVRGCLPTSPQLDGQAAIQAPTVGWARAVDTMTSLRSPESTATRLKILTRIVDPWLQREVEMLRELARPVSDAPMMRWLRFVSIDHHDDTTAISELLAAHADEAVRFDDHVLISTVDLSTE